MKTKIWKTIEIGGKIPVFSKDIYISDWAKDLLSKVSYATKKEKIDLIVLTPTQLGFTEMPTTQELFDPRLLKKYGLELCPDEIGPRLRALYNDQPNNEWLYIAHKPIIDSDRDPSVFSVERHGDGERWLRGDWASPGSQWDLGDRFVFRVRKSMDLNTLNLVASHSDTVSSELPAESSDEALQSAIDLVKKEGYVVSKII